MSESSAPQVERKFSSKLEEQASAKGEISYSFWAANGKGTSTDVPEPKKLSEDEAREQAEKERQAASSGASAWNAAGTTFEERDVTTWAKDTIKEMLEAKTVSTSEGYTLVVTELVSCSGDAHQWIVRGTRRAGFELELKLNWTLKGSNSASGSARIPEASSDDLEDMQLEIEVVSGSLEEFKQSAKTIVEKTLLPALIEIFNELVMKIKQK